MKFLPVRSQLIFDPIRFGSGGIEIMIFMISITKIDYFDTDPLLQPRLIQ